MKVCKEQSKLSRNIIRLDPNKYKNDDDLKDLLEHEEYEERIKFIENTAKEAKKNSFLKRVKANIGNIDQSRPVFDLVFIWRTLNDKCEEVVTEIKVKWQPSKLISDSWDNLEANAVTRDMLTGVDKDKDNLNSYFKPPHMPWKYVDDFCRDLGIENSEAMFFSRIEIRALEDRVILVICDRVKYTNSMYMFWEIDGKCDVKENNPKIDLEKKRTEFTAVADSPDNSISQKATYSILRSQVSSSPDLWFCNKRHSGSILDKDLVDEIIALKLFDRERNFKYNENDDIPF